MNIQWDASKYTEDFSFVHQYGAGVIELLELSDGMTVLDLGCGNGALTDRLAHMGVNAIGLDASPELLRVAKDAYPDLTFILADATDFELSQRVDAVFSNAVFHWIDRDKQPALLKCVFRALKPQGQFAFEFGGMGNNQRIHSALAAAFAEHGLSYAVPFYFPSIGEYAALLEQAGFKVVCALLFDRPTALKGENGMEDWIRMFVKRPFEGIDPARREALIHSAASRLRGDLCCHGVWYADYVRLRCKAIRP